MHAKIVQGQLSPSGTEMPHTKGSHRSHAIRTYLEGTPRSIMEIVTYSRLLIQYIDSHEQGVVLA